MGKAGFRPIAVGLSINKLGREDFIETGVESDWNNNDYPVVKLGAQGVDLAGKPHGYALPLPIVRPRGPPQPEETKGEKEDEQKFSDDDIPF